jgi:hypothetical protein
MPLPNRMAVYITGAISLLVGVTPLIGDLDWTSTAGLLASLVPILGVAVVWLNNWGKWERGEGAGLLPGEIDDEFDEETAEPIPDQVAAAAHVPVPPDYVPPPVPPPPPPGPGGTTAPPEARQ